MMDNNKSRVKDREKSNPDRRKMKPKDNAGAGMESGHKMETHDGGHEKSGR